LVRRRSGAFFANVGDDLVAFFFADGCERVAQPNTGFFAEVNQDFAVEPEISSQGKNSNLQNTNPLGCLSLKAETARTSTTEFLTPKVFCRMLGTPKGESGAFHSAMTNDQSGRRLDNDERAGLQRVEGCISEAMSGLR
jgi:hypothetical protein